MISPQLELPVPGMHNRMNATLAVHAAMGAGVSENDAVQALRSFPGVGRRMTERFISPDRRVRIVEDYAHHPTELRAALSTMREAFPDHRLLAVFQPHRFERVRRYGEEFSRILGMADEVVVVRPFAAWVEDGEIADPRSIADAITAVPCTYWQEDFPELANEIHQQLKKADVPAVVAVIGAGDVCHVISHLRNRLVQEFLDHCADRLRTRCPGLHISLDTPWSQLTSLGIGMGTPLLTEPADLTELQAVLEMATEQQLDTMPLGRGTNLVGSDIQLPLAAIRLARGIFTAVELGTETIIVGAGVDLPALFRQLMQSGRLPAEAAALAWIPSSVAGAVRMNAGANGTAIGRYVRSVEGLRKNSGELWQAKGAEIDWQYRHTDIPDDIIITRIELSFPLTATRQAQDAYERSGKNRGERQPTGRSAGCVFRNPGTESAGRLLERAGCKGLRIGTCAISGKHANFVIADKGATEDDFVRLVLRAQRQTYAYCGVRLVPEVVFANSASAANVLSGLPPLHLVVLKGGPSAERQISLRSGAAVAAALRAAGHHVSELDVTDASLPAIPADTDVVFPALHGAFGEDGTAQALLDELDLPYVGSGSAASARIMSKIDTKQALLAEGIPTPRYVRIPTADSAIPPELRFPLVIKPDCQGSTVGMSKLARPSGWWRRALQKAFAADSVVFAEEFVKGVEITVGVLHGQSLPVIEIVPPKGRMFDLDAKYDHKHGHTKYLCPPQRVSEPVQLEACKIAERVFHALGAKDMLRVDFIVDEEQRLWVLEANSLPGFTATSLLPKAAQAAGISFVELCASLVLHHQ